MEQDDYFTEIYSYMIHNSTILFCLYGFHNTQTPDQNKHPKSIGLWENISITIKYKSKDSALNRIMSEEKQNGKRGREESEENTDSEGNLTLSVSKIKYSLISLSPMYHFLMTLILTIRNSFYILQPPGERVLLEGDADMEAEEGNEELEEEQGKRKRRKTITEDEEGVETGGKNVKTFTENLRTLSVVRYKIALLPPSYIYLSIQLHIRTRRNKNLIQNITFNIQLIDMNAHLLTSMRVYRNSPANFQTSRRFSKAAIISTSTHLCPGAEKEEEEKSEKGEKKKKIGRSAEARIRRAAKNKEKRKNKKLTEKMAKASLTHAPSSDGRSCGKKPKATPSTSKNNNNNNKPAPRVSPSFIVQVKLDGEGTPSEQQRRDLMGFLALQIAGIPSSSSATPVSLRDSRVEGDRILLVCEDRDSQGAVVGLLSTREDLTVNSGPVRRRYAFGGPGYLTSLPGDAMTRFLENQNPGLPAGGLTHVSTNTGGRVVTVYVDVSEEAYTYLQGRSFQLGTMTTLVTLRPANGQDRRSH